MKNDIARGNAKFNIGAELSNAQLKFSIKKSVYLKYPSKLKLTTIPKLSKNNLLSFGIAYLPFKALPKIKLNSMDIKINGKYARFHHE